MMRGAVALAIWAALPVMTPIAQTAAPPTAAPGVATGASLQDDVARADDVVVTARRAHERRRAVRRQVDAVTDRVRDDTPLARFQAPVCIATAGLPPAVGSAILDRMIAIAEEAGIATAGERCTPNIFVLFADAGDAEIAALVKRDHPLLSHLSGDDLRALRRQPGPARSWGATEVLSRDGDKLLQLDPLQPPQLTIAVSSRIVSPIRLDIVGAVVMIDRAAVVGRSVDQIAGYAAMRSFARTRPPRAASGSVPIDTILSLFDAAPAPPGLTPFDRIYLRTLYQGAANSFPGRKQSRISTAITHDDMP